MQLQRKPEQNKQFNIWDWILVVGTVISPMTEFRVWKVGPGEALVMLWCIRYFGKFFSLSLKDLLPRFWILYLPVIALGTGFCMLAYRTEASPSGLLTFFYFALISCLIYVGLSDRSADQIKRIIYLVGILTGVWYLYLYYYSRYISYYFHGVRLWYGGVRFSGGATNPHQLATLVGAALFINIIHLADRSRTVKEKIIPAISAAMCLFVAIQINSSTLVVTIIVTLSLFLYHLSLNHLQTRSQKWIATSVLLIVFSVLIGIFREKLFDYVFEWIESDANGRGRFDIFASIGGTLRKNWLFGLGPGMHGLDGTIEYHNAYLEILAMGGIVGLGIFIVFSIRLFQLLMTEPAILYTVIPLYAYGLGGFSMRRLCFWIIVSMTAVYCARKKQALSEENDTQPQPDLQLRRAVKPRFEARP